MIDSCGANGPTALPLFKCKLQIANCKLNLQSAFRNQQFFYPTTSNPIDRAVPDTVLIAASSDSAFKSGIFSLAISSTCFAVTVPTLVLFGSADPFAMFAARFNRTAAGGVFVMKLYDRSAYTVTTTGMMSPSSFAVFALKFLQKSMMFTPCGPSAVPTGGAGVALPAAIWSFTIAVTFFAINLFQARRRVAGTQRNIFLEKNLRVFASLRRIRFSPPVRSPVPRASRGRRS